MPWHGRYPTNVRWREGGFQMRCPDCEAAGYSPYWWDLTPDNWNVHRGLVRCRACWLAKQRRDERERNRANPTYNRERNREYQRANRGVLNMKRRERRRRAQEAA
jgi:hypothetical protein